MKIKLGDMVCFNKDKYDPYIREPYLSGFKGRVLELRNKDCTVLLLEDVGALGKGELVYPLLKNLKAVPTFPEWEV